MFAQSSVHLQASLSSFVCSLMPLHVLRSNVPKHIRARFSVAKTEALIRSTVSGCSMQGI